MSVPLERTTEFVMSAVEAPLDMPVLFVKLSDGYLSLARLDDIERLIRQAKEAAYDEVQEYVGAHELDTWAGKRIFDYIDERLAAL